MAQIARLNDPSSHGGYIISAANNTSADGIKIARVGDAHSCPITGHGTTAIISGSTTVKIEGKFVALQGISYTGCGAIISGGSPKANAT
jgi:uncharacterized Zn-binding protein involved in type VI secretion